MVFKVHVAVEPPFLHPPTSPKFAWLPLSVMTNPPPVVKSHGLGTMWASAGTVLNVRTATTVPAAANPYAISLLILRTLSFIVFPSLGLRPLCAALRNTRCCRREHHIGDSGDGDMDGIDHRGAAL